ncbi:MAG: hypothetical protein QGH77_04565, partial [Planctomycetota bacterium]|nr:hypothetical protein [Planctomycetota bacterium]
MNYRLLRFLFAMIGLGAGVSAGLQVMDFARNVDHHLVSFDMKAFDDQIKSTLEPTNIGGHLGNWKKYHLLHELNVTGKLPEIKKTGPAVVALEKPLVGPDDLEVSYIQYVGKESPRNFAYIRPRDEVQHDADKTPGDLYQVGDSLAVKKKQGVRVRVLDIRMGEVDLDVVDRGDSLFTLKTAIYEVDAGVILAASGTQSAGRRVPKKTRMSPVTPNHWDIGSEDILAISEMPEDEILASVQTKPVVDPTTGKIKGLRISRLKEDSIFVRQGLRANDIVLEVNGKPAGDRSRLLHQLREQGGTSEFTITLERAGAIRTYTYS